MTQLMMIEEWTGTGYNNETRDLVDYLIGATSDAQYDHLWRIFHS